MESKNSEDYAADEWKKQGKWVHLLSVSLWNNCIVLFLLQLFESTNFSLDFVLWNILTSKSIISPPPDYLYGRTLNQY